MRYRTITHRALAALAALAMAVPLAAAELGQSFDIDRLSAAVVTARDAGDHAGAVALIDEAAAHATEPDRLLLAVWKADDLFFLIGADGAIASLAPLRGARGRLFERSWPHVVIDRERAYLAAEGRLPEAADRAMQMVLEFPLEADVPTLLEQVETMRHYQRPDAGGPDGLLAADLGSRGLRLGMSLATGLEPAVRSLDGDPRDVEFAGEVSIGPLGRALATIPAGQARRILGQVLAVAEAVPASFPLTAVESVLPDGRRFQLLLGADSRGRVAYVGILRWPMPVVDGEDVVGYSDASSGFRTPMDYSSYGGYCWLTLNANGHIHPGIDLNWGPYANSDCGRPIYSEANGLVRYAIANPPYDWGSFVIENRWAGTVTFQQGGHARRVLVSTGMTVSKGTKVAEVGMVGGGATACHLHAERRELDHPNPTSAGYWPGTANRMTVELSYDSPLPFDSGHPAYASTALVEVDEFSAESPYGGPFNNWALAYESAWCTNSDIITTKSNGWSVLNWTEAVIRSVPRTRRYQVYAWINSRGTSRNVPYSLVRNGTVLYTKRVDQYANRNKWVYIGYLDGNPGNRIAVRVTDATGEAAGTKTIAVERIQFR